MSDEYVICDYCGAKTLLPQTCQDTYNQLAFYTLNHTDSVFFIHQLIVDAYGASHARENSKSIGVAFALIGLYLFAEKGYTGKQVQLAHIQLAKVKREYPAFKLPIQRGQITAIDVLKVKAGKDLDQMIKTWAKSVWQAFIENRQLIINTLSQANFKDLT